MTQRRRPWRTVRRFASGGSARSLRRLGTADAISLMVGVAQGLIIARALGPESYGLLALSVVFATLVFSFLDPRSAELVPRYVSLMRAQGNWMALRSLTKLTLMADILLAAVGSLLVAACSGWLSRSLLQGDGPPLLPILAGLSAACIAPAATGRTLLITLDATRTVRSLAIGIAACRIALIAVVLLVEPSLTQVLWLLLCVSLTEAVGQAVAAIQKVREVSGKGVFSAPFAALSPWRREMTRFVFYASSSSLVSVAVKNLDVLILGWASGPTEGGFYRLAKSLTAVLAVPVSTVQGLLYPRLAHADAANDRSAVKRTLRNYTVLLGLPLSALMLVLVPFLPVVVTLSAGRAFSPAGEPAILLTAGLAVSALFLGLRPTCLALGEMRLFLALTTTTAILGVMAFGLVAEPFGAVGVAWARLLVVGVLGNLVGSALVMRRLRASPASKSQ